MKKTLIERIEVGSGGAASITFSAISQDYDDLLLVVSGRSSDAAARTNLILKPNGTSNNTRDRRLIGFDSDQEESSSDASEINLSIPAGGATADVFGSIQVYIPNYTASVAKSISAESVSENNSGGSYLLMLTAGLFDDTTAITSLEIDPQAGNFVEFSSATLYGITAGSDGTTTVS